MQGVYERFLKQKLIRVTLATEAGLYFTREGPSSIYTYSMHDTSSLYVLGDSRELSPLNSGKLQYFTREGPSSIYLLYA